MVRMARLLERSYCDVPLLVQLGEDCQIGIETGDVGADESDDLGTATIGIGRLALGRRGEGVPPQLALEAEPQVGG